jgi:hypothetical protein
MTMLMASGSPSGSLQSTLNTELASHSMIGRSTTVTVSSVSTRVSRPTRRWRRLPRICSSSMSRSISSARACASPTVRFWPCGPTTWPSIARVAR